MQATSSRSGPCAAHEAMDRPPMILVRAGRSVAIVRGHPLAGHGPAAAARWLGDQHRQWMQGLGIASSVTSLSDWLVPRPDTEDLAGGLA